jgi:hypothetical protein
MGSLTGNQSHAASRVAWQTVLFAARIMKVIVAVVLIFLFLILTRYIMHMIKRRLRVYRGGWQERLLFYYHRCIQRELRHSAKLKDCINYREQLQYLQQKNIWNLSNEDVNKLSQYMEQAGFSQKGITQEIYQWSRLCIKKAKKQHARLKNKRLH